MILRKAINFKCPVCRIGKISSDDITPICCDCGDKLKVATVFCTRCGYPLDDYGHACRRCTTNIGKHVKHIYSTYKYNGIMSKLMVSIKFDYGITQALVLPKMIIMPKIDYDIYDAIIPMPSHPLRAFARFFHPADIIAQHISKVFDIKVDYALNRDRNTPFQSLQRRENRAKNVSGAFSYDSYERYKRVLLVDDIITTGSSIDECAKVLKHNGVKHVDCYALAHS